MNLADFQISIPGDLIAQSPAARGHSRLLDLSAASTNHRSISEFGDLLNAGDLLVLNNTKVVKARLIGEKDTGGRAGILVERVIGHEALCQVRVSKPLKTGRKLIVADQEIVILGRVGEFYRLGFPQSVYDFLQHFGEVPLPPYIERNVQLVDEASYQTVFAEFPGAVAAPTAGLHFSDLMLKQYQDKGVEVAFVTLHVGAGTFQPVRVDDLSQHQMHSERFAIEKETIDAISMCKAKGGRVIAVGTTVVRTLEAVALSNSGLHAGSGETKIFITPGFEFKVVDALLTNFHLSESTLLMLVSAFMGHKKMLNAYQAAVAAHYRFFSYGDAMFCVQESGEQEVVK